MRDVYNWKSSELMLQTEFIKQTDLSSLNWFKGNGFFTYRFKWK